MFPRARIQRFNEVTSDVPPPGAYDPKFESKVKGVGMDKMTERFTESKLPGPDSNIQRSASLSCLPVFRTPQSVKKSIKKTTPSSKLRPETSDKIRRNINQEFSSSEDLTSDSREQLKYLQEQLNATNQKLEETEFRCRELEDNLSSGKDSIDRLELERMDLSKEIDRLMIELSEESTKLSEITEQRDLLDASLAERKAAVAEMEQSQTELLLELSVLKKRAEQNAEELEESVQHCMELENALSEAKSQNLTLLQSQSSLSSEVVELTDRLNEATMQIQARDEHCETLEKVKCDLVALVDDKTQALENMNQQLRDSENRSNELASLLSEARTRTSELEDSNLQLRKEVEDLECRLENMTSELKASQAKCEALDAEIEVQKQIISQMEDTKNKLSSELLQVKTELESTQACLYETQRGLEETKAEMNQYQEDKSKLEAELRELSLFCADLQQKLQQRQQLILGLQADLSNSSCELEERRAEAARQAKKYRAEIDLICSKHDEELSSIRQELDQSVADWEARVAQAQVEHELELANLRDLAYKLEQRVLEEREAYGRLDRTLEQERDEHEDAMRAALAHNHHLDKQIEAQREDLAAAAEKLKAAEQALQDEKQRAHEHIVALTRDSEARITEIELSTRKALQEAEINLCAAEAAYTETLKQVHSDTQALVNATKAEALQELENIKADSERRVHEAQVEVSVISSQLRQVQDELHQVIAVRDNLKSSDLEKQVTILELQDRVSMMELERTQSLKMLEEAQEKLNAVSNELELMKKIRRNLEIIGHETLATVNAVSKRLLESDDEVERLSQVNSVLETNLNEQKESLTAMEKENIQEIHEVRSNLLSKVEAFKQKCVEESEKLQEQIHFLQESIVMYAGQLEEANRNVESLERDRNEQAAIIADLQQTTNELQATQDFLAQQVEDYILLKQSHKALQGEIEDCKDQLIKAKAEAADGEMEIQHREKQIAELSNQLDDLNDKITELQGVILELETTAIERDHLVEQLERKLELQKESAQKADWQISDLTRENDEIRNMADQLNSDLERQKLHAKQEIEALSTAKLDLQSQIESMNTVLECHKMNVLKATERIESLDNVVVSKEKKIEALKAEIEQLHEDLLAKTAKITDLSSMIEDKNHALLSSHQAIDGLLNNVKTNEKQIRDLNADLAYEKAFRVECELKMTEILQDKLDCEVLIEDLKENVLELESDVTEKNALISLLEKKTQDSVEKIDALKDEAKISFLQISEAEKNMIILEADKFSLQEDIVSLNSKVADQWGIIEKQVSEISTLNTEIQNQAELVKYFEKRLEENRNEINKLEGDKMSLESEVSTLKMQAEMNQWENEEEKRKCESLEAKVGSLENQVTRLEEAISIEKSSAEEREKALTEEMSSLKISLGTKTQEVGTIRGQVQKLEAELDQTTRRKETYKAAVVELQQAVKQSRSRMQTLEEELQDARSTIAGEREENSRKLEGLASIDAYRERCEELEALIGPFREQLEAFESERQALESRKEAAEGEVKELAQRYAQVLGHQNHKQKIHHVLKLKEQMLDLKKENEKLETLNRSQKRTIDKLKDELARSSSSNRFNPAMAFKCHDESFQGRLSLAHSKSLLENSSLSKSLRGPSLQSTAKKGKENISAVDLSTPLSSRSSAKVKDEIQSPVRHSPVGSPITPLKEVQNQQQVN